MGEDSYVEGEEGGQLCVEGRGRTGTVWRGVDRYVMRGGVVSE